MCDGHSALRALLSAIAYCMAIAAPLCAAPGDEAWSFQTGGAIFGSPARSSDGVTYVGSRDGRVYAIAPDGTQKWSFLAGDWVDSSPTLNHDEDTVYFGCWDNSLYAVDASSGQKRWSFATGSLIIASPALDAAGNLYFGSSDGFFYALEPNGAPRWSFYVGEEMDSSPAVAEDGTVYVAAFDGRLYAFDGENGSLLWNYATPPPADAEDGRIKSPPTIDADGNIYFGGGNGALHAVDPTGQELWTFSAGEKIDTGVAIGLDGRLIFASRNGTVYCLDRNGLLLWESYVGDVFYSTPALDEFGQVYIGNYLGNGVSGLTALGTEGEILWEFLVLDYVDASPLLDEAGRAVFAAYDGAVYGIEAGAEQAFTEWSRFGGDRSNRSLQNALGPLGGWPLAFRVWAEDWGLVGSAANPDSDADGDGVPLGLEFATGGNPEAADSSPQLTLARGIDGMPRWELSFGRLAAQTGLSLRVELSVDLLTWAEAQPGAAGIEETIAAADAWGDGLYEWVRVSGPLGERLWARLRADPD